MRKSVAGIVLTILGALIASGCGPRPLYPPADFRPAAPAPAPRRQSVDTFIVVLDISPWMSDSYQKRLEAERAREIVSRLNRTIPDLGLRAGLIASAAATCFGCEGDRLLYGPEPYRREEFAAVLSGMGEADARVSRGLYGAAFRYADLLATLGRVALIVVSDGENIFHGAAAKTAQKWKSALGERLCIYPILVGSDPAAFEVMRLLSRVGGCGFAVSAEEIAAPESMAEYVQAVFLAGGAAAPPPPARPPGAEADADGDGVPDRRDRCPGSPAGAPVGPDGCWSPRPIAFDSGQAAIRDSATPAEIAAVLKANPDLTGEIHGHTDDTGPAAANARLARARAEALRDHLAARGIAAERLRVLAFGETRPAAGNDTAAGRALNRRAEFIPARR
jgi:OOP family OmpA-OmpF porin